MPAPPPESEPAMVSAMGAVMASPNAPRLRQARRPARGRRPRNHIDLGGKGYITAYPLSETRAMVPFFVQIKCKLGQSYTVANALAVVVFVFVFFFFVGFFHLLVKFYLDNATV